MLDNPISNLLADRDRKSGPEQQQYPRAKILLPAVFPDALYIQLWRNLPQGQLQLPDGVRCRLFVETESELIVHFAYSTLGEHRYVMHEILATLPPGSRVLDLGSGAGSFEPSPHLQVFRADIAGPADPPTNFVLCSAAHLPFAGRSFRAIISNHSLEHFEDLEGSIKEIARVLTCDGLLYIAVPDASTFTDRLYRWLGRGGGHINQFTDPEAVVHLFTTATSLPHAGTRVLGTSLSFLNRRNIVHRQRKLLLFANGNETVIRWMTFLLRMLDRYLHLRASVYGWAFYFGSINPNLTPWTNVCIRCGSAAPSVRIEVEGRIIRRSVLPDIYSCLNCGAPNFFTRDSLH
jgi:SAM-dependent methyltransferase